MSALHRDVRLVEVQGRTLEVSASIYLAPEGSDDSSYCGASVADLTGFTGEHPGEARYLVNDTLRPWHGVSLADLLDDALRRAEAVMDRG